jgi:anti-sigma B factor antagonist
MNVTTKEINDIIVIEVEGSIDSKTAPQFESSVVIFSKEKKKLILDMTKVEFMSSAGLRVLLMLYRNIKSQDGTVVLAGVSEEIKDVMSNTGFIGFFTMVNTVDEGVNAVK